MATPLEPEDRTDRLRRAEKRDGNFVIAIVIAFAAVIFAVFSVGLGWRAVDESKANAAGGAGAAAVTVTLTEFAITPVSVGPGGSLNVVNGGTMTHNLVIEGTDLKTADLAAGESATLELGDLAPGTYKMFCAIPGHRASGMEADLVVSADATADAVADTATGHSAHATVDYQKLTDDMLSSANAFPAKTEGVGNVPLEPTEVRADGTKVYDLTMEIAPWEVDPGNVVEAWTFDGMVPGPKISVEVNDKVEVRVKNDLPIATDVHWHGLKNSLENDGVAPYTQDLIEPGASYTYTLNTERPSVSMYHPHAHGHQLLPDGMFGVVLVGDMPIPEPQTVGYDELPADITVSQEIPMVLNDSGAIGFSLNGKSFPATAPVTGNVGDWILVHYYNEGVQIHPMHLHQFDQIVIAKDGLPLTQPYAADTVMVAPGERYSVLVKLDKPGTWVWHCHILPHAERESGMFGMVTAVIVTDPNAPAAP